jgi:hypothetical protein
MFGNDKLESGKMVIVSGCGLLQSTTEKFARWASEETFKITVEIPGFQAKN